MAGRALRRLPWLARTPYLAGLGGWVAGEMLGVEEVLATSAAEVEPLAFDVAEQSRRLRGGLQRAGPADRAGDQLVAWARHHVMLTVMAPTLTAAGVTAAAACLLLVPVLVSMLVIAHVLGFLSFHCGVDHGVGEALWCPSWSSVPDALAEAAGDGVSGWLGVAGLNSGPITNADRANRAVNTATPIAGEGVRWFV